MLKRLLPGVAALFLLLLFAGCASKLVVIDNRSPEEYAEGHLKGTLLIEYGTLSSVIEEQVPDKTTAIKLYCLSGQRSEVARSVLEELGYENVENLGSMENASSVLHIPIVKDDK